LKPEIDARADLYSIGIVIYESLNGQNPYVQNANNIVEVIQRMESQDLPPLKIPGDHQGQFSIFISSLVQRFPSRRPQTANEALDWFFTIYQQLKT